MKKRIVSAILSVLMLATMMPMTVGAKESSYIEVRTVEDLYCVRNNLAGNYILANDIDLTEATKSGGDWDYNGKGWWPIGYDNQWVSYSDFTGIFDGNGHSIIGMRINADAARIGLFASVKGTIRNLTMQDVNISSTCSSSDEANRPCTGAIAAMATGIIENCSVSGSVQHRQVYSCLGGIVGYIKNATVRYCYNTASIYGSENAGGIVGYVDKFVVTGIPQFETIPLIQQCYNTGKVESNWTLPSCPQNYAGGIAGYSLGIIADCYNEGNVSECYSGEDSSSALALSNIYVGGIVGKGDAEHCYNIGDVSAAPRDEFYHHIDLSKFHKDAISNSGTQTQCYYLSGSADSPKSTSLSETQAKLKSMYTGFDFDNVWMINNTLSYPYPQLRVHPQVPCDHSIVENILKQSPTCTVDGHSAGTQCKYCGKILSGLSTLPATGHAYNEKWSYNRSSHWRECSCGDKKDVDNHTYAWKYNTTWHWQECFCGAKTNNIFHDFTTTIIKAASCEDSGTERLSCSTCGYSYTKKIPATGHSYSAEWKSDTTSHWHECSCGDKSGTAVHTYDSWITTAAATHTASGSRYRTCTVCGYRQAETIPASSHSYGTSWESDATSHWHECSCGDKSGTAAHTYGDWVATSAATHAVSGSKYRTCTVCGYKQTEAIPATDHSYDVAWKSDSTNHWHECSCGDKIDTVAHTYGGWTTTTAATHTADGSKYRTCTACGYKQTEIIPVTSHSFDTIWHSDDTNHWHECSCGDKNDIAAHVYGDWVTTSAATHTTDGSKYRTCTVCGYKQMERIPASRHSYDNIWHTDAANHWHECSCGDKSDVVAHTYGDWVTTSAATHTTDGSKYRTCTTCGYKQTETIPTTDHSYGVAWKSDSTNHWRECSCGDKSNVAEHSYINGVCSVCGYIDATVSVAVIVEENVSSGITAEIAAVLSSNEAVNSFTDTGLDSALAGTAYAGKAATVKASAKSVTKTGDTTTLTFDIAPYVDGEDVSGAVNGSEVTVRVPLTAEFTNYAKVEHDGDDTAYYEVQKGSDGAPYIDIVTTHFSSFTVSNVDKLPNDGGDDPDDPTPPDDPKPSGGCYVATCVYGSYDCPEVWTLRRFRDETLAKTWYGRLFIRTYYAISPTIVKWFGDTDWFKDMWRGTLDKMVADLNAEGVPDTPYDDIDW